jgi:hypothetical protein
MCLGCGYDGPELQDPAHEIYECPHCFQDLYERPPMSYAEMEGITASPESPTLGQRVRKEASLFRTWLTIWLAYVVNTKR